MFAVTENALAKISRVLGHKKAPDNAAVRLKREPDGVRIRLDSPKSGDTTFDHEGKTVLVLDEEVSKSLAGRKLDVLDNGTGPRLTLV